MTVFSLEQNIHKNYANGVKDNINLPNGLVQNLRCKFMALIEMEKMDTDEKLRIRKFKSLENINKKIKDKQINQSMENLMDEEKTEKLDYDKDINYDFAFLQSKFGKPIINKKKYMSKSINDVSKRDEDLVLAENSSKVQQIRKLFARKSVNSKLMHNNGIANYSRSDQMNENKRYLNGNCAIIKPILHGKSLKQSANGVYYFFSNDETSGKYSKTPNAFLVNVPDKPDGNSIILRPNICQHFGNTTINNTQPDINSEGYWKVSRDLVHKIRAKGKSYRFENGKKQELPTTIFPNFQSPDFKCKNALSPHIASKPTSTFDTPDQFSRENVIINTNIPNDAALKCKSNSFSNLKEYFNLDHKRFKTTNVVGSPYPLSEKHGIANQIISTKGCSPNINLNKPNYPQEDEAIGTDSTCYYPSKMTKLFMENEVKCINHHGLTDMSHHQNVAISAFKGGNILDNLFLPGASQCLHNPSLNSLDLRTDLEDEDDDIESILEEDYAEQSQSIQVQGAYVKLAKTCFMTHTRRIEMNRAQQRITFDPDEPATFEYPSEQCLLDIALENENVKARIQAFNEKAAASSTNHNSISSFANQSKPNGRKSTVITKNNKKINEDIKNFAVSSKSQFFEILKDSSTNKLTSSLSINLNNGSSTGMPKSPAMESISQPNTSNKSENELENNLKILPQDSLDKGALNVRFTKDYKFSTMSASPVDELDFRNIVGKVNVAYDFDSTCRNAKIISHSSSEYHPDMAIAQLDTNLHGSSSSLSSTSSAIQSSEDPIKESNCSNENYIETSQNFRVNFSAPTTNTSTCLKTPNTLKMGNGIAGITSSSLGSYSPKHHRSNNDLNLGLTTQKSDPLKLNLSASVSPIVLDMSFSSDSTTSPSIPKMNGHYLDHQGSQSSFYYNKNHSSDAQNEMFEESSFVNDFPTPFKPRHNHLTPLALESDNELSSIRWSATVKCADILF